MNAASEERISLAALARQQGVSHPTVFRWTKVGIRGIRLECFSIGGRWYTTVQAYERFDRALNEGGAR